MSVDGGSSLPLSGVRVIDLGSFWAAPYLTEYLGAFGADVIKIESIQRPDGFRFSGSGPLLGDLWHDRSLMWQGTNHNKRDITLALNTAEGKALLTRLIAGGDVFVENYAARVVEQFGFGYEQIAEINPSMVVLRVPGFGLTGPWRDFVGWGNAFEQLAGHAWITGQPDGPPQTPGGYIDPTVGMHAAVALLAALEHRDRTGEGQLVEVAQIEVGAALTAEQVFYAQLRGEAQMRQGNRSNDYAPQGVYQSAEARNVAVTVRNSRDWAALYELLGRPDDLADLERLADRRSRQDDLDRALGAWMAGRSADEAVGALRDAGIPAAAVLTPMGFNEDPQLAARGYYQRLVHPLSGPRLYPTYPMHFSFEQPGVGPHRTVAPTLGQHNHEILAGELDLSEEEIADLAERQVIGTTPLGL